MRIMVTLLFLLYAVSGIGLANEKIKGYINTGAAKLLSPQKFAKHWYAGLHVAGGVGYQFSRNLETVLNVEICEFSFDRKAGAVFGVPEGDRFSGGITIVYSVFSDLKFNMIRKSRQRYFPYLVAGGGWFARATRDLVFEHQIVGGKRVQGKQRIADSKGLGIGFGSGLQIDLNKPLHLFMEVKYNLGMLDASTGVLIFKIGFTGR